MTRIKDLTELTCILRNVIDEIHSNEKFKRLFFLFLNEKSIEAFKCFIRFVIGFIEKQLKHLKSCINIIVSFNFTDSKGRVLFKPVFNIGNSGLKIKKLNSEDICKLFINLFTIKKNRVENTLIKRALKGRIKWFEKEVNGVFYGQSSTSGCTVPCDCPPGSNYDSFDRDNCLLQCTFRDGEIITVNCNDQTQSKNYGTTGYSVSTPPPDPSCECSTYNLGGGSCTTISDTNGVITCLCPLGKPYQYLYWCLKKNSDGTCTDITCP